jgi:hypothetical protein
MPESTVALQLNLPEIEGGGTVPERAVDPISMRKTVSGFSQRKLSCWD